jgi:hypothetical protein
MPKRNFTDTLIQYSAALWPEHLRGTLIKYNLQLFLHQHYLALSDFYVPSNCKGAKRERLKNVPEIIKSATQKLTSTRNNTRCSSIDDRTSGLTVLNQAEITFKGLTLIKRHDI